MPGENLFLLPVADGSVESALLSGTPAACHNFYISVLPLQKAVAFAGRSLP